jgi:hypothetical protein
MKSAAFGVRPPTSAFRKRAGASRTTPADRLPQAETRSAGLGGNP